MGIRITKNHHSFRCSLFNRPEFIFEEDQIAIGAEDYVISPSKENWSISILGGPIAFAHGLTPAKRNPSQSSLSSKRKGCLDELPGYYEPIKHH